MEDYKQVDREQQYSNMQLWKDSVCLDKGNTNIYFSSGNNDEEMEHEKIGRAPALCYKRERW